MNPDHGVWPLESESLTAANLQQVCIGLNKASSPIYVSAQRSSRLDVLASLYACSIEGRESNTYAKLAPEQIVSLSNLFAATRILRCFGWLRTKERLSRHLNCHIPKEGLLGEKEGLNPEVFEAGKDYYGIVYKHLPPAELDAHALQQQIDFLYYAGFAICRPPNKNNWQGP